MGSESPGSTANALAAAVRREGFHHLHCRPLIFSTVRGPADPRSQFSVAALALDGSWLPQQASPL